MKPTKEEIYRINNIISLSNDAKVYGIVDNYSEYINSINQLKVEIDTLLKTVKNKPKVEESVSVTDSIIDEWNLSQ